MPAFFLSPPHLPNNSTAFGARADSRSMIVAALALPIPKLIIVIPSAVAFGIGRSRPLISVPLRRAKIST
jgi:hypothetical protein